MIGHALLIMVFSASLFALASITRLNIEVHLGRGDAEKYRAFVIDRLLSKTRRYETGLKRVKDPASAAATWISVLVLFALAATVIYFGV